MATITRDLGLVRGLQGEKGPQGDSYELTNADKEEIAGIVGTDKYLPKALLQVDVYNSAGSIYPSVIDYCWDGTITIKDMSDVVIATFPLIGQRLSIAVAPYSRYKISATATGYQTADAQIVIVKDEVTVCDYPLEPVEEQMYTVKWVSKGVTLWQTEVEPHAAATYEGVEPTHTGSVFMGWDKTWSEIVADTTITAQWVDGILPDEPVDVSEFDYAWTNSENHTSAYTQEEFVGILLLAENVSDYLAQGDKILYTGGLNPTYFSEAIEFRLESFKHHKLSDGSGWARTSWVCTHTIAASHRMNSSNTNTGGWPASEMRNWMNGTLLNAFPEFLKNIFSTVEVKSTKGSLSGEIVTSNDKLYLPAYIEWGYVSTDTRPYSDEVEAGANEQRYPFFTDNNSRRRGLYGSSGYTDFWLRSPPTTSSSSFWRVQSSGAAGNITGASSSYAVVPCFSI